MFWVLKCLADGIFSSKEFKWEKNYEVDLNVMFSLPPAAYDLEKCIDQKI